MVERDVTRAAFARIEEAQEALRETLRDVTPARLNKRPPSGEWSPMEHVRHLIVAQQHHFRPHLPKGFRWASAGVPPPNRAGERRLSPVGSEPGTGIDDVFRAWAKVNAVVGRLCADPDDTLVGRLEKTLKHFANHATAIGRLLRSPSG